MQLGLPSLRKAAPVEDYINLRMPYLAESSFASHSRLHYLAMVMARLVMGCSETIQTAEIISIGTRPCLIPVV